MMPHRVPGFSKSFYPLIHADKLLFHHKGGVSPQTLIDQEGTKRNLPV